VTARKSLENLLAEVEGLRESAHPNSRVLRAVAADPAGCVEFAFAVVGMLCAVSEGRPNGDDTYKLDGHEHSGADIIEALDAEVRRHLPAAVAEIERIEAEDAAR
jgi:hypothetical protein